MSRADFVAAVGRLDYPPTETMWEELENEIRALRSDASPELTDGELLRTARGKRVVFDWRRNHELEPKDHGDGA